MNLSCPLISIIVPIYNADLFISHCIKSVLEQDYSNFELLLINDGSFDNSLSIINSFQKNDNRIHVFSQKNSGVNKAREIGFEKSSGDYIMFLDADDKLNPQALTTLFNAFEDDVDLVSGSIKASPSNRIWLHKKLGFLNKNEYAKSIAIGKSYGYIYASLYRKRLFHKEVFDVESSFEIGEDVLMKIYLCKLLKKAKNISDIVYDYIDNDTSMMNTKILHPSYYFRYMDKRNEILNKINVSTKGIITELNILDSNKLINLFLQKNIPFDKETYYNLKPYIEYCNYKHKLLYSSKYTVLFYKKLISFFGIMLQIMHIKNYSKPTILY